ncbi:hypothetical protein QQG55_15090 [Brugia pahangi]
MSMQTSLEMHACARFHNRDFKCIEEMFKLRIHIEKYMKQWPRLTLQMETARCNAHLFLSSIVSTASNNPSTANFKVLIEYFEMDVRIMVSRMKA